MKLTRMLLLAALLAPIARAADLPSIDTPLKTGNKAPNDAAVVIGVEDYWKLADVPYALADAAAFYDWAVYTRGIPVSRVERLDNNPGAEQIAAAVKRAGASTASGGTVWLYFSGHGMAARDGRRMVLGGGASGTSRKELEAGGAFLEDLEVDAGGQGARVVAVIDACYTGDKILGDRTPVPAYSTPRSDVIEWLAAAANETSGPLDAVKHGAFTYFALGALRGWADGQVDAADGKVLGDEAQLYVESGLKAARITGQRPEMRGAGWSELVLATVAVPPARKPVPSSTSSSSFGDISMADPSAQLAEQERDCGEAAKVAGVKAREARFGVETTRVQAEASTAWVTLSGKGEACVKLTDVSSRETCAKSVDEFVARAKAASVTLSTGDEVVKTACGERAVGFVAETRSVAIGEVSAGVALAARIRVGVAVVEAATGKLSVNVSGGWADVYVDGKKIGTTPVFGQQLAVGTHAIRVKNDESGLDETKTVTIRSGETSVAAFSVTEAAAPGATARVAVGPPPVAGSLEALRAQAARFMALDISGPGPGKFPNKVIDTALRAQLVAEAKALIELEHAVTALVGSGDPASGIEALAIEGRAYEELANDLERSFKPLYLTADQLELYSAALNDKADPQRAKARVIWQQIVDMTADTTLRTSPLVAEARAALAASLARAESDAVEADTRKRRLEATGRPKLEELRRVVTAMQAALAASRSCVPQATAESTDLVLEQAIPVLEADDLDLAGDMLVFAQSAKTDLDAAVVRDCRAR